MNTCSWFLLLVWDEVCQEGWAGLRPGSITSQGRRKIESKAHNLQVFSILFCSAVILRFIAPLSHALIFLLYHDSCFPSEQLPASQSMEEVREGFN